jgi:hypothetical protein
MLTTVYVYLGEATYTGSRAFEWHSPEVGARHKLMLFLAQATDESQPSVATRELGRFGFTKAELAPGKAILVESLNAPKMQAFQKHYEEALDAGSSIVWYPDRLQQHAT